MATDYGSSYSGTDALFRAPGTRCDAGVRSTKNQFNLATTSGGTPNTLLAAKVPAGCEVTAVHIAASVDCSAINLQVGTAAAVAKYGASSAGPNATQKEWIIPITTQDDSALAVGEDIIVTPSGNWPANGTIVTRVVYTKR